MTTHSVTNMACPIINTPQFAVLLGTDVPPLFPFGPFELQTMNTCVCNSSNKVASQRGFSSSRAFSSTGRPSPLFRTASNESWAWDWERGYSSYCMRFQCPLEEMHQALPAFPYCKQRKAERGTGNEAIARAYL